MSGGLILKDIAGLGAGIQPDEGADKPRARSHLQRGQPRTPNAVPAHGLPQLLCGRQVFSARMNTFAACYALYRVLKAVKLEALRLNFSAI